LPECPKNQQQSNEIRENWWFCLIVLESLLDPKLRLEVAFVIAHIQGAAERSNPTFI